jgi:WD40 repeat protein/serine/threonine protein kinase
MNAGEDRNLLFGVLAMQFRGVSPIQLAQCASAWSADRSRNLADILVESGFLTPTDREFLNRLVDEAIEAHAGDVVATLADFGGAECIDRTFQGRIHRGPDEPTIPRKERGIPLGQIDESFRAVDETPGRYRSVSEYARGGMGRVLLVYDEHLGREVAMKELLPFTPGDETITPRRETMAIVARFLQEARITGQLEHPSIVPVYELGRHSDNSLYYTMKLVRGRTLSEVLKTTSNLAERLALLPHFADLSQAIAYAHSCDVIHRDIKPGNVMIGEFGETVVLDWGLAKPLHGKDSKTDSLAETLRTLKLSPSVEAVQTTDGQVLGTPIYMPPEQATGELHLVDQRSDVYSLGAILYELLTGRKPHEWAGAAETLRKVIEDNPVPVLAIEPAAPLELVAVCNRAMARDRADRYPNAKELADEINRFQTGALVVAHRYSLRDYLKRWLRRHRAVATTAAAAALLLTVISVGYVVSLRHTNILLAQSREEEQRQRIDAEQARDRAEMHSYLSTIRFASEYLDSNRSDQAYELLWNAPVPRRNWEWGHLLHRSRQYAYLLPQCGVATYDPYGQRIATISRQNGAQLWNAADGRLLTQIQDVTSDRLMTVRFSPDGTRFATAGVAGLVKIWDAETGTLVSAFGPRKGVITELEFSPEGNRVVAVSSDAGAVLWDVSTGSLVRVLESAATRVLRAEFSSDGFLIATAHDDDTVRVWHEDSDEPRVTLPGRLPRFRYGTHELALLLGSDVVTYDADTGQATGFRVTTNDTVNGLRYSHDGTLLAVSGENGISEIVRADDGLPLRTLDHGQPVADTLFNPDLSVVLTISESGLFKVWDLHSGAEVARFRGHSGRVAGAEFSPDNIHFLSMGYDHVVHVWNALISPGETTVAQIGEPIVEMCAAPEARRLALVSASGVSHVIDFQSGEGIAAFAAFVAMPFPYGALSPDGSLLASVTDEITPILWDVEARAIVASLTQHSERINRLTFSPDSKRLAIGYKNGTGRIFDAGSGQELVTLNGHVDGITAIQFLPDGERLVTASKDKSAVIWEVKSGSKILELSGHTDAIDAMAVSPNGSHVMTSGKDKSIREWDTTTGESRTVVQATPDSLHGMAYFSSHPRTCIAATDTRTARLWDIDNGQELICLDGHSGALSGIYCDRESSVVLTASLDGSVRAWKAAPWVADLLPGTPTDSWPARYAALHEQVLSTSKLPILYTRAAELVVAVPGNILSNFLAEIRAVLSTPNTEATLPNLIVDKPLGQILQPLGVNTGDIIEYVNDVALSKSEARAELGAVQTALDQGRLSALNIRLIRNGQPATIEYHSLQPFQKQDRVELPAAKLLEILAQHQKMLVENRANILDVNNTVAGRSGGLLSRDSEISGLWIMEGSEQDEKEALAALHLQSGDRCVSIGGTAVTSVEDLEAVLSQITERIQSDSFSSTTIVVMRGTFQRVEIEIRQT